MVAIGTVSVTTVRGTTDMGPKAESRRDAAQFAQYERECEEGFVGSFAEWLQAQREVSTAPVEDSIVEFPSGPEEDCPF